VERGGEICEVLEGMAVKTHPGQRKQTMAMRQTCTTGWLYHLTKPRRVGRGGNSAAVISAACMMWCRGRGRAEE